MHTFTIYLLKEEIRSGEDAVVMGATAHTISEGSSEFGTLFVKASRPKPPKWSALFLPYVEAKKLGSVQSAAAVFIVSAGGRFFALSFGQGRFILRPGAFEERFGLLVTLNSIQSNALRSVDKRAFVEDQNSRVQTGQAAGAPAFGVDIERDLIRGIVGTPTDAKLGRKLAGADALTVTVDAQVPDLKRLLRRYLRAFRSTTYKEHFSWVDQVRQLHPKGPVVAELDALLERKLEHAWANNGRVDGCWISIPDIVEWETVRGFKFTTSNREGVSTDLNLPALVHAYPNAEPTVEFLKSRKAMAVNEDEQPVSCWPVFRCVQCEVDHNDKSYVLSAGHWFEVDKDFVRKVDTFVATIPIHSESLLVYNHENEGAYNEAVVAEGAGRWCLMDKKNLRVGGIHDQVEFCDFYGENSLFHVKHYGSSSLLGHLFNQGLVSGELLRSHADLVTLANAKLDAAHQLPIQNGLPRDVSTYTIVFAVISQSTEPTLHLPFFAKVVLKNVCTRLGDLGYGKVELLKIDCHPDVLVKKLKSKSSRGKGNRRRAA